MRDPLVGDDLWKRRGISLIWDADALNSLCKPSQVISLRQFRTLHSSGWNDVDSLMVNEESLVVAGLESCIDYLPPAQASQWLQENIYREMVSYQREVAGGGTEASLIFWIVEDKRLKFQVSDDAWFWHCGGEYKKETIPIGKCLFNGSQNDLKEIQDKDGNKLGLYHPRIAS